MHHCQRRRPWRSTVYASTLLPLLVLTLFSTDALARRGEAPYTPAGAGLPGAPALRVDTPDVGLLKSEDQARYESGEKTFRYAEPIRVFSSPSSDGMWETLADGTRMWRMSVVGKDATDINLGFEKYELPYGARLWVISADHDYYEGPYTNEDNADHGQLWVPVVPGDEVVVELQVPAQTKFEPSLEMTHVGYGYTDMFGLYPDKQGSCNNDVICPEGDPWRDQIQSVATYSLGGSTICTGQMVTDADGTFRPFFLTAYHCGVSSSNAASMTVYWNFESPECGLLSGGSLDQNQTGAVFRARRQDVDMALVELDELPQPEFNVFYSGWDRSGVPAQGSVAIHHPGTDEKAISFNDDPLTIQTSCIGGFTPDTHWRVDNWEDGTTEPGSSGSGIWDPANQLLVGFLSGGLAACGNQEYDCYGRFDVAWDGASASERLRDWLDPNGVGGEQVQGSFISNDGILQLSNFTAVEDCNGTSDGIVAPGETVTIDLTVVARFGDVTGMSGELTSSTPGVTITQAASTFPDALKDQLSSNLESFVATIDASVACFSEVDFLATISDDQGNVFDFPITLPVGNLQEPAGLPLAIPDGSPAGISSDFTVGEDVTLTDVDVNVQIEHTWVGDLIIQLQSPSGTTVTLLDRPGVDGSGFGCSDNNMNVTFDDSSLQQLENLCSGSNPWYSGSAAPASPLSAFNGESSQGTWSLFVSDNAGADTGSIVSWELIATPALSQGVCEPCAAGPSIATVGTQAPGQVSIMVAPDGSGDRLDAAQLWSGVTGESPTTVDATVTVDVADAAGDPVVGYPAANLTLGSSAGSLIVCDPQTADADTDVNGRSTFGGALRAGGGSASGEGLVVDGIDLQTQYAAGGTGLDILFNSPDLTGDGLVDLVDVGDFAALLSGGYSYAVDYVWDGQNNIADVGRFAESFGAGCIGVTREAQVATADARMSVEFADGTRARALEPGQETDAYVVLRGQDVRRGITAWEATLETSDNVRLVSIEAADGSLDMSEGKGLVVGAGAAELKSDDGSVVLARVRLAVTDALPASIELTSGPIAARGESGPGIVVEGEGLRTVDAGQATMAMLNGDLDAAPGVVRTLSLANAPNPFNPATEISLRLPEGGEVELAIFDVSGRRVRSFELGTLTAGEHSLTWRGDDQNGRPVVSGVYYARTLVDGAPAGPALKMSLLK